MKIKPLLDFELLGTNIKLDKNKTYKATKATNQPKCDKLGLVFCKGILLNHTEYKIVEN
jgi:hypothetical protein